MKRIFRMKDLPELVDSIPEVITELQETHSSNPYIDYIFRIFDKFEDTRDLKIYNFADTNNIFEDGVRIDAELSLYDEDPWEYTDELMIPIMINREEVDSSEEGQEVEPIYEEKDFPDLLTIYGFETKQEDGPSEFIFAIYSDYKEVDDIFQEYARKCESLLSLKTGEETDSSCGETEVVDIKEEDPSIIEAREKEAQASRYPWHYSLERMEKMFADIDSTDDYIDLNVLYTEIKDGIRSLKETKGMIGDYKAQIKMYNDMVDQMAALDDKLMSMDETEEEISLFEEMLPVYEERLSIVATHVLEKLNALYKDKMEDVDFHYEKLEELFQRDLNKLNEMPHKNIHKLRKAENSLMFISNRFDLSYLEDKIKSNGKKIKKEYRKRFHDSMKDQTIFFNEENKGKVLSFDTCGLSKLSVLFRNNKMPLTVYDHTVKEFQQFEDDKLYWGKMFLFDYIAERALASQKSGTMYAYLNPIYNIFDYCGGDEDHREEYNAFYHNLNELALYCFYEFIAERYFQERDMKFFPKKKKRK